MIDRKQLKESAKDILGHELFGSRWLKMLLVWLIYDLIVGAVSGSGARSSIDTTNGAIVAGVAVITSLLAIAALIVTGPLEYGMIRITTKCARENKEAEFDEFLVGFKECMSDAIILNVLTKIFIFLWTLLLIIPGIIKSYAYSMAIYIQQDQKNKDWRYCLDKSKEMTNGHKWELFVLDLSFIGWFIVGLLCFGIGLLWVIPYYQVTKANFYLELKKQFEPQEELPKEEVQEGFEKDVFSDKEPEVVEGEIIEDDKD